MGKLILVTGAAGKLGSNVVRRLAERGYRVRALVLPDDPLESRLRPFDPQIVRGDMADAPAAEAAVAGVDGVVHLASIGHVARDHAHFFTTDTVGTYNLVQAAARCGTARRFVQASSFVSYGPSVYEPVDEHHPQRPNNTLGLVKLAAEQMCEEAGREHALPTVRLRFTWVFGGLDFLNVPFRLAPVLRRARQAANEGLAGAKEAVAKLEGLSAGGDERLVAVRDQRGKSWTMHVVDVRDLVALVEVVLEHPSAVGEAFNVASPAPISYEQGAPYLATAIGLPCDAVELPLESTVHLSTAKARSLIGWTPRYDYFASVDDAVRMRDGEDIGVVRL